MTLMPGLKGKYDAWNRLVEVRNASDVLMATYGYNGLNQRVKKTVGSTVTTSFYNSGWQELESKTGNDTTSYVWGLRYIDDLILRERGSEKLYSLADPNWNVVAIANASGTIQERMKYDAFGKVTWMDSAFTVKANSAYGWNRMFTGQVLDAETGLMLYRNRFYHTGLGRFITRDPIGYEANDVSLYRYVGNRSTLLIDPHGEQASGQILIEFSDFYIYTNTQNVCYRVSHRLSNFRRTNVSVTTGNWYNNWRNRERIQRLKEIAENMPMPSAQLFWESSDCDRGYCCKNKKPISGSKKGIKDQIKIPYKELILTYTVTIDYTFDHSWSGWVGECEKE
jgi:RHS repeat-associated protein